MATKKYDDQLLESLHNVYKSNPDDLDFKKYFALELYKKGKLKDARPLLAAVFEVDKDLNVERALNDIVLKLGPENHTVGFVTGKEPEVELQQAKKNAIEPIAYLLTS